MKQSSLLLSSRFVLPYLLILTLSVRAASSPPAPASFPWLTCDQPALWGPSKIWGPGSPKFSSYSGELAKGRSVLRLDFRADKKAWSCVGISPTITGTIDLSSWGGFTVEIYNPLPQPIPIKFAFRSGEKLEVAARSRGDPPHAEYGKGKIAAVPAGPGWRKVEFVFDLLKDKNGTALKDQSALKTVTGLLILLEVNEKSEGPDQKPSSGYVLLGGVTPSLSVPQLQPSYTAPTAPARLEAGDPGNQTIDGCLSVAQRQADSGETGAAVSSLLRALDICAGHDGTRSKVACLYRDKLDPAARNDLKSRCRERYDALIRSDPRQARGYASLHRELTDIWSQTRPLFSYCLGTQAIGCGYQFTKKDRLLECAEVIRDMGSDTIKLSLTSKASPTLAAAAEEPKFKAIFDMPFRNILLWCYPIKLGNWWSDGTGTGKERQAEYRQMYDLTVWILKNYDGSGKTFLLGNWEGDWHLTGYGHFDPSPGRIEGMIAWFNLRQQAIDDAKRDVPHSNVAVYGYMEVNDVRGTYFGGPRLINTVLPFTHTDYVSFSSYGATASDSIKKNTLTEGFNRALDCIESYLPPRDLPGKRVWIGEYGYKRTACASAKEQDKFTRATARAALTWGCPFVLYWQLYCNEYDKKNNRFGGFWTIDDKGAKQPVYDTHVAFFRHARDYEAAFTRQHGHLPSQAEFNESALAWLLENPVAHP